MPMVWLSTLDKLIDSGINPRLIEKKFSGYKKAKQSDAISFEMTDSEKDYLWKLCNKLKYDQCNTCSKQICGNNSCQCGSTERYRQEYRLLTDEIAELEKANAKLVVTPFRQLRNSYGYVASVFGALNLVLTTFTSLGLAAGVSLLIALPAVLGVIVYVRGRNEERLINNDNQADVIDRKVSLFLKHRAVVNTRYRYTSKNPEKEAPDCLQAYLRQMNPKPSKEKRGIPGNSFSHFTVAGIATISIIVSILKWSSPALFAGPAGLAIAAGVSLAIGVPVGIYFGYTRYKHLNAKVAFDEQLSRVTDFESKLKKINRSVKRNQENIKEALTPKSPAPAAEKRHANNHRRRTAASSLRHDTRNVRVGPGIFPPVNPLPPSTEMTPLLRTSDNNHRHTSPAQR